MKSKLCPSRMSFFSVAARVMMLASVGALAMGCSTEPSSPVPTSVSTQAVEPTAGSPALPATEAVAATEPPAGIAANVATNPALDYCFAYPEGFTQNGSADHLVVVGPQVEGDPQPGLGWVDTTDAQGKTAQEVADAEVEAVGGLNPTRSTIELGGEEALVLDGMPGQDLTRKVYIVHGATLYTLAFAPAQPEYPTANAQMESLYSSATSSWVWISSGAPCPAGNAVLVP